MNPKPQRAVIRARRNCLGFTLIELLLVIGIIGLLAGLLLPALSRAKVQARSIVCKNQLKQIGLTLSMYVSDAHSYPPAWDRLTDQIWAERIYGTAPLTWTNRSWHCPSYMAAKGTVTRDFAPRQRFFTSYEYNAYGIIGTDRSALVDTNLQLGLGWRAASTASEPEILSPSEMFIVADARAVPAAVNDPEIVGFLTMTPYFLAWNEKESRHGDGYNILFGDGHAALIQRINYLFPPRTARNWNRDNQPHPETWSSKTNWVVLQ